MYVGDLIGGAARGRVPVAIETACGVGRGLLGPKAISEDKTERTTAEQRRLDVLGYTIDLSDGLDEARVTISKRNRLKAAYGFFSVDISKPVWDLRVHGNAGGWGLPSSNTGSEVPRDVHQSAGKVGNVRR